MKKVVIAVKDTIAEIFHDPRIEINIPSAIRAFTDGVKDSPHKDDFSMYVIGEFDTQTGVLTSKEPTRIYSGHDVAIDLKADLNTAGPINFNDKR